MLLIKNAKIYTMADRIIEDGDILINKGKIIDIGKKLIAKDAHIIDAKGLIALPGLVDAHTHIGVMNFRDPDNSEDNSNEMTNNITPEMQAIYGADPQLEEFKDAYRSGVTTIAITPGSGNVVGGWVFATKTYGKNIFHMCIKNPIALKVALGGNPKGVYGERKQEPSTRMAIAQIIKKLLRESKKYMDNKEVSKLDNKTLPKYNSKYEALIPVLKKEIPLKIHCTQFDMMTAIEIANEFDLRFTLDHAWGASEYIDEIVNSGCDIVFGPIGSLKSFGEASLIDIESVIELDKREVLVALITDAPILSIDSLIHHAGEAVREGCEVERALRMITINPAKIMGVDDRVGSIEIGKDADVVLFQGVPSLETNAKLVKTIINGEVVYSA